MNAEMTPIVIQPFRAKYAPKTATTTNATLLSMFMTGPMLPPMISAMMPTCVSLSAVSENARIVGSWRLYAVTVWQFVTYSSTVPFRSPSSSCRRRK